MSGFFKSTFGKDDNEKNLQYDNTAFLFFIMSIIATVAIVLFVSLVKQIRKGSKYQRQAKLVAKDPLFQQKLKGLKGRISSVYTSPKFILNALLLIVILSISAVVFQKAEEVNTQLKGFDPFELLGVNSDTPLPQIKKAYRRLALQLHPDRNPNNPEAAAKFIFISKAYECLTDETKKQKCLKYGNPQGQSSFNVGIALPSFLVEPEYQLYVLAAMFILLLIVIPRAFLSWNKQFQAKDSRGILIANYYLLYRTFICGLEIPNVLMTLCKMKQAEDPKLAKALKTKEQTNGKTIPKGKPAEQQHNGGCCDQDHGDEEHGQDQDGEQQPKQHQNEYEQFKNSLVPVPETQSSIKNLKVIQKFTQKQIMYDKFLELIPDLLRSAIYFSLDFATRSNKRKKLLFKDDANLFIPYFGTGPYSRIATIFKNFYQNGDESEGGLESLALTPEEVLKFEKDFTLRKLVMDAMTKQNFLKKFTDTARVQSLKRQIELMPALQLKVETLVDDIPETTFTNRDTVTFKFHISKNPTHGVAFLPNFGYLHQQKFFFTLQFMQEGELIYFEQIAFEAGQTQINIQFTYRGREQSTPTFLALVRSDCYFGLDVGKKIPLKFVQYTGQNKIHFNKEDLFLQKIQKGYFEQMLSLQLQTAPQDEQLSETAEDQQELVEPDQQKQAPQMEKIQ